MGNSVPNEMSIETASLATNSSLTNTDSETAISGKEKPAESPASVQEHNHNHVKNPTLWFKGTEGRKKKGLNAEKYSSNFGLYSPVTFSNEQEGAITCYFFVYDNDRSKFFGPGSKFTNYVDPVGRGNLCICLFN